MGLGLRPRKAARLKMAAPLQKLKFAKKIENWRDFLKKIVNKFENLRGWYWAIRTIC